MTRLAVLSDIHGNLPALEAVLCDLAQFSVDQVIVAGDVINWGPFSAQVVQRITREGWTVMRGNHEFYLLDQQTPRALPEWDDVSSFPLLPWLHRQLNGSWQDVIDGWPDTVCLHSPDAPPLSVFHGSPMNPRDPIYPTTTEDEIQTLFAGVDETFLVTGHTHLAMDRRVGRWRVLNPGSVGVPLDGKLSAGYMLLDGDAAGWRPSFRRVPFDYGPLFREFERQHFLDECGVVGRLVLEEFETARAWLYPFLHWRHAICPEAPLTMSLLEEFAKVDPRGYMPEPYRRFWIDVRAIPV
ncbi:MAG: metallophosphoesterase family protein [Acidobacteriota bacterium]